jgi:transcriptional regulator with XRE-family HTH domain
MTDDLMTRQNGEAIRALRRARGKGVVELAGLVKIHPQSLRNIENGRRQASHGVIRRLARELGVSVKAITRDDTGPSTEAEPAETKSMAA